MAEEASEWGLFRSCFVLGIGGVLRLRTYLSDEISFLGAYKRERLELTRKVHSPHLHFYSFHISTLFRIGCHRFQLLRDFSNLQQSLCNGKWFTLFLWISSKFAILCCWSNRSSADIKCFFFLMGDIGLSGSCSVMKERNSMRICSLSSYLRVGRLFFDKPLTPEFRCWASPSGVRVRKSWFKGFKKGKSCDCY